MKLIRELIYYSDQNIIPDKRILYTCSIFN